MPELLKRLVIMNDMIRLFTTKRNFRKAKNMIFDLGGKLAGRMLSTAKMGM